MVSGETPARSTKINADSLLTRNAAMKLTARAKARRHANEPASARQSDWLRFGNLPCTPDVWGEQRGHVSNSSSEATHGNTYGALVQLASHQQSKPPANDRLFPAPVSQEETNKTAPEVIEPARSEAISILKPAIYTDHTPRNNFPVMKK